MSWTIPAVSLSAVTLTTTEQDGTVIDLDEVLSDHGVQWVLAHAASDTWVLLLEGSLDGSDWYAMGSYQQGGSGTGTAATEVVLTTASFFPARYVRAGGYLRSGSGPAVVTATVTSR